jgi:hypothetical protein
VRRTNAVTVRDGREPLDMPAGESTEGSGLCLTQLRELLGHVLDRAVVLAQLHTDTTVVRRRREAVLGQSGGQRGRPLLQRQVRDPLGVARL